MTDEEIIQAVGERIAHAEEKHPGFACGVYQALGYLEEEAGEVARAITKGEGTLRMRSELLDVIAVAWRMLRGEYEQGGGNE